MQETLVYVVPLPCKPDELRFDIILPEGHAKTVYLDELAVRCYRSASIAEIIEHEVITLLESLNEPTSNVKIVYR